MIHLLRSLFIGYFVAVTLGTLSLTLGAPGWSVLLGVWFGGSALSVLLAATMPVFPDVAEPVFVPDEVRASSDPEGPMKAFLSARELAMWDQDLAAERFEAEMAAEDAEAVADKAGPERKTG